MYIKYLVTRIEDSIHITRSSSQRERSIQQITKKTDGVLLGSFHIPSLVIFLSSNDFIVDISMIQFLENINYHLDI